MKAHGHMLGHGSAIALPSKRKALRAFLERLLREVQESARVFARLHTEVDHGAALQGSADDVVRDLVSPCQVRPFAAENV